MEKQQLAVEFNRLTHGLVGAATSREIGDARIALEVFAVRERLPIATALTEWAQQELCPACGSDLRAVALVPCTESHPVTRAAGQQIRHAALKRFGRHHATCARLKAASFRKAEPTDCTCGFTAALAEEPHD